MTEHDLVVWSWFNKRRLPYNNLEIAQAIPYSGAWARGGTLFFLEELSLEQKDGSRVLVSAIVGKRRPQARGVASSAAFHINEVLRCTERTADPDAAG